MAKPNAKETNSKFAESLAVCDGNSKLSAVRASDPLKHTKTTNFVSC